ncbi:hypothetical protein HYH03_015093 [Edaphochlamys debaryana]|uniref:Uncharacterized protein n=1 Tax=Edaphochlamys debaryana TaxID=47281 RepID=A0A835XMK5_9CHLO|nr:hypothetical protein HYH03_015093 [Edaphochlamys debaryana]|eukprot:KAG2486269.1 hypothetical protein HYH03_015093 [Edaphochlamys debaryana]
MLPEAYQRDSDWWLDKETGAKRTFKHVTFEDIRCLARSRDPVIAGATAEFMELTRKVVAVFTAAGYRAVDVALVMRRDDKSPMHQDFLTGWEVYCTPPAPEERRLLTSKAQLLAQNGLTAGAGGVGKVRHGRLQAVAGEIEATVRVDARLLKAPRDPRAPVLGKSRDYQFYHGKDGLLGKGHLPGSTKGRHTAEEACAERVAGPAAAAAASEPPGKLPDVHCFWCSAEIRKANRVLLPAGGSGGSALMCACCFNMLARTQPEGLTAEACGARPAVAAWPTDRALQGCGGAGGCGGCTTDQLPYKAGRKRQRSALTLARGGLRQMQERKAARTGLRSAAESEGESEDEQGESGSEGEESEAEEESGSE